MPKDLSSSSSGDKSCKEAAGAENAMDDDEIEILYDKYAEENNNQRKLQEEILKNYNLANQQIENSSRIHHSTQRGRREKIKSMKSADNIYLALK